MVVSILNNGTAYTGNDFSIDDISLKQVGRCQFPTPVGFDADPTTPACDLVGTFDDANIGGTPLCELDWRQVLLVRQRHGPRSVERNTPGEVHLYVFSMDDETTITGLDPPSGL